MIKRIAHAKINLTLHITGQREDGYHLLDSLVSFAEIGDRVLVFEPDHAHGPIQISVDGPFGDDLPKGSGNLVTSAALILRETLKKKGVDPAPVGIHLEKILPVASGIGGGSADAAAALVALSRYWNCELDLEPIANALGADVAMCLRSVPLRARGIGNDILPVSCTRAMPVVLVNPGHAVSTQEIFSLLECKSNPTMEPAKLLEMPEVENLATMRNDLQRPAVKLVPEIAQVLEMLTDSGADLARMSGSGATCFGLYSNHEQAHVAALRIKEQKPGWWSVASSLRVS